MSNRNPTGKCVEAASGIVDDILAAHHRDEMELNSDEVMSVEVKIVRYRRNLEP